MKQALRTVQQKPKDEAPPTQPKPKSAAVAAKPVTEQPQPESARAKEKEAEKEKEEDLPMGFFDDGALERKARKNDVSTNKALMRAQIESFNMSIQADLETLETTMEEDDEMNFERRFVQEELEHEKFKERLQALKNKRKRKANEPAPAPEPDEPEETLDSLEELVPFEAALDVDELREQIKDKREKQQRAKRAKHAHQNAPTKQAEEDLDWRAKSAD
eukprot:c13866_g1_i1.p1 GENE.c13866_g1_i1~~c13866_g1_i1.p1  ORF type:complete len:248 (+),score=72.47 c13866_g1_i1:92-745(+)